MRVNSSRARQWAGLRLLSARCRHMRDRDEYRDDCPTAFNLARREVLLGGVLFGLATLSVPPAISAPVSWSDEASARFMEISALLIPHRLNKEIGKRIGAAMSALN